MNDSSDVIYGFDATSSDSPSFAHPGSATSVLPARAFDNYAQSAGDHYGPLTHINNRGWLTGTVPELLRRTTPCAALVVVLDTFTCLDALVSPAAGWHFDQAPIALNDRGQILVSGVLAGVRHWALLTPTITAP